MNNEFNFPLGVNVFFFIKLISSLLLISPSLAFSTTYRPNKQIGVLNNFCICNKEISIYNYCKNKRICKFNNKGTVLFGETILSDDLQNNPDFGSLEKWCHQEIDDGGVSPSCILKVEGAGKTYLLNVEIGKNSNRFKVDLNSLKKRTKYKAWIQEFGSNTNNPTSFPFYFTLKW